MEHYEGTVFGRLRIPLHVFHQGDWGFEDVTPYMANTDLLDWNQEREERIYNPNKDPRIPPDVRQYIEPLLESRRKEAEARGVPFFDGQMVRLVDYGIRVEDKDAETEKSKLVLGLAPTSWFIYMATNRSYDEVLPDDGGSPIHMRNKYGVNVSRLDDWLANPIGVSTTLISEPSGAVIIAERSSKLTQYPSLYGVAAAGFMNRINDSINGMPNPFKTMQRELEEEVGIESNINHPKYGFRLLGLGRALDDLHPELWGETLSPLNVEQILSSPKRDKYEHVRLIPVEFEPKKVVSYIAKRIKEVPPGITSGKDAWIINQSPAWVPAHVIATIQSLERHYEHKQIMEELERALSG